MNDLVKKHCVICAKDIPNLALKCTECDSYQNWRRHLDFGNTFLALLIALISILTVAFNQLSNFVVGMIYKLPDFQAVAQISELDGNHASVLVSNQGNRPFVSSGMFCQISRPTLSWIQSSEYDAWPRLADVKLRTAYFFKHEPILWTPGQSGILKLISTQALDNRIDPQETDEQRSICVFSFKDSSGTDQMVPIELRPIDLTVFSVK